MTDTEQSAYDAGLIAGMLSHMDAVQRLVADTAAQRELEVIYLRERIALLHWWLTVVTAVTVLAVGWAIGK